MLTHPVRVVATVVSVAMVTDLQLVRLDTGPRGVLLVVVRADLVVLVVVARVVTVESLERVDLLATHDVLERQAEVFQMVGVEERVQGRVEVAEDDAGVEEGQRDLARGAVGLYEVDGVEGHPADDEEEDDDGEVLSGLDLSLPGGA